MSEASSKLRGRFEMLINEMNEKMNGVNKLKKLYVFKWIGIDKELVIIMSLSAFRIFIMHFRFIHYAFALCSKNVYMYNICSDFFCLVNIFQISAFCID